MFYIFWCHNLSCDSFLPCVSINKLLQLYLLLLVWCRGGKQRRHLPASLVSGEDCSQLLYVHLNRSLFPGHSYEDKLIGLFHRKTEGAFQSAFFAVPWRGWGAGSKVRIVFCLLQSKGTGERKACWPPEPGDQGMSLAWQPQKLGHLTYMHKPLSGRQLWPGGSQRRVQRWHPPASLFGEY